jgi:hypothetical protein
MKGGCSACQGGDIHDPLFYEEVQRKGIDLVRLAARPASRMSPLPVERPPASRDKRHQPS